MNSKTKNETKISASQAREKLLKVWDKCEFGIKERVKKAHSPRTLQYILNTESYSKTDVILSILDTIKKEVEAVRDEAISMSKDIEESLSV